MRTAILLNQGDCLHQILKAQVGQPYNGAYHQTKDQYGNRIGHNLSFGRPGNILQFQRNSFKEFPDLAAGAQEPILLFRLILRHNHAILTSIYTKSPNYFVSL